MTVVLPASLRTSAIATPTGSIALFLGAGCSMEQPTNLRSGGDYSEAAHQELVASSTIAEQANPRDLSALADAVFKAVGTQSPLVNLLPRNDFQVAQPNAGHKIAIALLVEHVVGLIVTVNLDLALDHAAAMIARGGITLCHNSGEHALAGRFGVVYLHGTAHSLPDDWILRAEQIEHQWNDTWHAVMMAHAAAIPTLVFAGLGSPAPVISESVQKVAAIVKGGTSLFQIDPTPLATNKFAKMLGIGSGSYIEHGWNDSMEAIGQLVAENHLSNLDRQCTEFCRLNKIAGEDHAGILALLTPDLLWLGKLRSKWFMDEAEYKPFLGLDLDLIADCLVAVATALRLSGANEILEIEYGFELRKDGRALCRLLPITGGGSKYWAFVEPRIEKLANHIRKHDRSTPLLFMLSAVSGTGSSSVPKTLVPTDPLSIVSGLSEYSSMTVDELRTTPDMILKMIA